jgi:phage tail sheath protein FI
MAYSLSPGVTWSEVDLTTIVPAASTTEGAFAGNFDWGPVDHIVTISNELDLVRWFGKPSQNSYTAFFTAANFLSYGNNLKVVRSANTIVDGAVNATTGAYGLTIKNEDDYENNYALIGSANTVPNTHGMFAAKYPGELGNSLKVSLWCGQDSATFDSWEYSSQFEGVTGTSSYVSSKGGANDEMHLIVVDRLGKFSNGEANTVLERFSYVSKASDAVNDDGSSNFWVNVVNDKSQYLWAINHALDEVTGVSETSSWGRPSSTQNNTGHLVATAYGQSNASYTMGLFGGKVAAPTNAQLNSAYDLFLSAEEVDVSLIMTGDAPQVVSEHVLDNIVGIRKDCVAFVSPDMADVVDNAGSEVSDIVSKIDLYNSTSFGIFDGNWKKQFDKYNNVYRWVPLNGDIAGLCARTDFDRDPWFSPAGFNRGQIKNVVKLAWNPTKAQRDDLYKNNINPVVTFKGEGTVLYGDKTMQRKPSAFDRINVRRLFIVLEKTITKAAKYSLFEFNDEFTRAQFVALVEPFLRDVKGRRGIYDFKVVCDTTNNTPEIIDRNEFRGDIYIKPARSINFIQLNFVAVRTGVAFSEIVGKF